jgi:DNA-directed RNA polymerase specialized sigma subunit
MIRSEAEYQEALRRLEQDRQVATAQRDALVASGLSPDEVEHAMEPLRSFQAQLEEEVAWYEEVRRRNFPAIRRLTQIGRLIIALRIANGLTQRELAERLGVSEAVVSRDERNEYHGITVERAQRILDALNATVVTHVEETAAPSLPALAREPAIA